MSEPIRISVFIDYICPFCFIGSRRLLALREDYNLQINWCLVEIHPETPAAGMPVEDLSYTPDQWQALNRSLNELANEDGLSLPERRFTANSHPALLLAEGVKHLDPGHFYALHTRLFETYFLDGENIGQRNVLDALANDCGISEQVREAAWNDPEFERHLEVYRQLAGRYGVRGVPTYVLPDQVIPGVASREALIAGLGVRRQDGVSRGP
ncbi:MAG: DsbA family protein [Gammaproteobacteria bacterium]|jgi:predicted DsbA family dithiol-disulfide isomerase